MKKAIDLGGSWDLFGTDTSGNALSLIGTVPGCVHTDLIQNGIIGDIYYRDNSKNIQWIEHQDFQYAKTFSVEELHENAYLEFDGLDTYCDVYLNGKQVGSADDMFLPYAFCVDGTLQSGENRLEVCFRSPIKEISDRPPRKAAFTNERVHTRRMQCTYGWDWVDRFVTMGIYRDVRIVFRERNEIDHLYVYTNDINPYCAQIRLNIHIRDFVACEDKIHIAILDPDGKPVFEKDRVLLKDSLYEYIDIPSPKLWYPNGYGAQPLYTVRVSTATSLKEEQIGIRKVTIIQPEDPEDSDYRALCHELESVDYIGKYEFNQKSAGFIILVNGIKIMCKGANWVPCEPFPSAETPEKIKRLLDLAVDANMNILRVWGGGIFEREEFYAECDRRGILVTQDFLMACGHYPEDEDWFIEALRKEATAAVLRLRNHPCLVYWSGDNENAVKGSENRTDFPGYLSAAKGLEPVVSALDPQRYFFPSSPYGGDFYCCSTRGTTHNTYLLGPTFRYLNEEDLSDYRAFFSKQISRFCAEQAAFGMSFVSSLEKYLSKEDIFGDDLSMLEYHTKSTPGSAQTIFATMHEMARKIFGDYTSGEDRIRKQQMLHCEWTRISFELYRRHKGFSWGLIYWMFNDCWPAAAGWSFLDHFACPKPAYYLFKRCAQPVVATISEESGRLSVHVSNDLLKAVKGHGELYLYDFVENRELWRKEFSFAVEENAVCKAFECNYRDFEPLMSETTILLCDVESKHGQDRAFFIPIRFCDLDLEYAAPQIVNETESEITVTTDQFLPYAMLDVPYLLSENCFPLKKGEIKTIRKIKKL